jgi:transposase
MAVSWADRRGLRGAWHRPNPRMPAGRLERDLLAAGERVVRVPPRLMAGARQAVPTPGKSDPIDALAVARAALREPTLPVARHDQASWEVKLLVDHREHLVAEPTRTINRLRWHLHQLDPDLEHTTPRLPGPGLDRISTRLAQAAANAGSLVQVRICQAQVAAIQTPQRPDRSAGPSTMHAGVAPVPVSSGRTDRHRLSRGGNRQLNAALHPIAITQLRLPGPGQTYDQRRRTQGDATGEAVHALKRRIARAVYQHLKQAQQPSTTTTTATA